jgi:hypothetical protein
MAHSSEAVSHFCFFRSAKETEDARLIGVYSGYAALFPTRQENFSSLRIPRMRPRAARRHARAFHNVAQVPHRRITGRKFENPAEFFRRERMRLATGFCVAFCVASAELASFPHLYRSPPNQIWLEPQARSVERGEQRTKSEQEGETDINHRICALSFILSTNNFTS